MDRTVATPSAGYQTGVAPRPARVLDTPLSPSAPLRQTQGGAADVRLRATGGAPVLPSFATEAHARESGPVLRVLLSAAVVVLAGGGGFWLYIQKKAAKPQPPASAEASAPAATGPGRARGRDDRRLSRLHGRPGSVGRRPRDGPGVRVGASRGGRAPNRRRRRRRPAPSW